MSYVGDTGVDIVSAELEALTNLVALSTSTAVQAIRKTSATTFENVNIDAGSATWGMILGTLSNQTDLQSALDAKQNLLVNSAGLLAALSDETGTGVVVFNTAPTFLTSILTPLIIGSTSTTGDLTLQTTSGVGTTGADMHFLVGNNGATEAMTILNSGNVGIGTTTINHKLDVAGTGHFAVAADGGSTTRGIMITPNTFDAEQSVIAWNSDVTNGNFVIGTKNTGNGNVVTKILQNSNATGGFMSFYTGAGVTGTEKVRILADGNVGIGTTSPTNILSLGNSAAQKFWIENTATDVVGRALTVAAGSTVAGTLVSNVVGGNLILQSGLGTGTGASTISFQTGTTLTTGTTLQTMSTKMTILGSGNVGIGLTNPSYTLDINKAGAVMQLFNTTNGGTTNFYFSGKNSGGTTKFMSQIFTADDATNGALYFVPNTASTASAALTIQSSGNVGIGTTNPGYKLSVIGASGFSKLLFMANNDYVSGSVGSGLAFESGATSGNTYQKIYAWQGGGGSVANLVLNPSGGNVGIGTTAPTAYLHLKAGTATASTAPLKFNTGTLLTTAEAGAMEFLTDDYYLTQTTNAIRGKVVTTTTGRATAQTAANASVQAFTLGAADASFEVSANVLVTTSSAENFTVTVDYTDEGNTARTATLNFELLAGTIGTAINFANGAVPYEGLPIHLRVKASTTITVKTTGTFTGVSYNIESVIKRI